MRKFSLLITLAVLLLGEERSLAQQLDAAGQDSSGASTISVFLDCNRCDRDYIRREISYINYVRDRQDADVHLLITSDRGGAGRVYTLFFIGRRQFEGVTDTLTVMSSYTDTDDERRRALAHHIQLGLLRYLARTPSAVLFDVVYDTSGTAVHPNGEQDKWDYWSFRISTEGDASAESSTNSFRLGGRVSADRVTHDWKIRLAANGSYREENFDLNDSSTVKSTFRNGDADAMVAKSLGQHWSMGVFSSLATSSFNNIALKATIAPAIEYNIFPYSESSRRAFAFGYYLGVQSLRYDEVTIYEETQQIVLQHRLEADVEFEQPWGSASASLSASNYITDFSQSLTSLYRIQLFGYGEIRIVRGLSVFAWGNVSRIRDQIFLPRDEASEEDILLGTIQLPTDFAFSTSIGLSYRFGSIYNNIVNPRFGI